MINKGFVWTILLIVTIVFLSARRVNYDAGSINIMKYQYHEFVK